MIDHPEWGSWGGRFERVRNSFFRDASDTVYDSQTGNTIDTPRAAVFRWRDDFQMDFAYRCSLGAGKINQHYPSPVMATNGLPMTGIVTMQCRPGDSVEVTFTGDDAVSWRHDCIHYPEPGTYGGQPVIQTPDANRFLITVPYAAAGKQIHLIFRTLVGEELCYPHYNRLIINILRD